MGARTTPPSPAKPWPAGVASPARRALAAAGLTRLEQLTRISEAELLKLHGMGPKAVRALKAALAERGLSLAGPARARTISARQSPDCAAGARSRPLRPAAARLGGSAGLVSARQPRAGREVRLAGRARGGSLVRWWTRAPSTDRVRAIVPIGPPPGRLAMRHDLKAMPR